MTSAAPRRNRVPISCRSVSDEGISDQAQAPVIVLDFAGFVAYYALLIAGWSSPVARRAHNPKVVGSNPAPATNLFKGMENFFHAFFF